MPFTIERNDLVSVEADAIVIAANEHLQITGGVGMTVARAAGFRELQAACDEIGFCSCGSAVATPAFGLNAKAIVHAVGPIWRGGDYGEADFLRSAYDAALECAASQGARSIALPLISAGTYGFPADMSLAIARESIRAFLNRRDGVDVRLVLYSREAVTAGMAAYLDIAEYIDDHYVDENREWYYGDFGTLPAARSHGSQAPSLRESGTPSAGQSHGSQAQSMREPREASAASARERRGLLSRINVAVGSARTRRDEGSVAEFDLAEASAPAMSATPVRAESLEELLNSLDASFSITLLALIDERGLTDAQVYKRANISRQHFSKIRSDENYRPTKKTVLALAVALGLDLNETNDLLARAGFVLSNSNKADVIVEYFIKRRDYDIYKINEALYAFDQPLL